MSIEQRLVQVLGAQSEGPVLGALFAIVLVIIPLVLMGSAAALTAWLSGRRISSVLSIASEYSYALVPLGFGVWLAHYGFHLLTGILTVIPVTQSAAVDLLGLGGAWYTAVAAHGHEAGIGVPDRDWSDSDRRRGIARRSRI